MVNNLANQLRRSTQESLNASERVDDINGNIDTPSTPLPAPSDIPRVDIAHKEAVSLYLDLWKNLRKSFFSAGLTFGINIRVSNCHFGTHLYYNVYTMA